MKKKIFCTACLMMALISISCSKDEERMNGTDNSVAIRELNSLVMNGSWTIMEFMDSGSDETVHFSGFTFTFNADGSLVADNGSETINGSWSITDDDLDDSSDDDSNSDDGNNDIDFNIFFASPPDFNELTEDWHILTRSATRIELIHISGGNGGTDTLIFVKA